MALGHRPDERDRRAVQHGRHGHAPRRAPQRRVGAARRGEPGDVRRPLARGARGRDPGRVDHQRRARRDLGVSPRSTPCCPTRSAATGSGPVPSRGRRSHGIDDDSAVVGPTLGQGPHGRTRPGPALRDHGLAQGRSASELEWVDDALDPNALTICFARRMATYKRAALLLSQPERLEALLARRRPTDPVRLRRQGPPGRRSRQGAHPPDRELLRTTPSPRRGSCSSRTTTWPSPGPSSRARTSG